MENRSVAKFFVETILEEQVDEIAIVPQEYILKRLDKVEKKEDNNSPEVVLTSIRYDFVATIKTINGEYKKILIEVQKSLKPTDLLRFRTYLGEQYKRLDIINVNNKQVEKAIPIVTVYMLGFNMPGIKSKAIKVGRSYIDMTTKTPIKGKSEFMEGLTHEGYFMQIQRITGKPITDLDRLLSIFEQQNFVDDKKTIKQYKHPIDNPHLKEMINILSYVAADPKERRCMEEEYWMDMNEEEYEKVRAELKEQYVKLEEKNAELKEERKKNEIKDAIISETNKTLSETNKALSEKEQENEKLRLILKQAGINP
jgi:hypothetical protein